jgi:flagellar hook-basal body complex protein FliE
MKDFSINGVDRLILRQLDGKVNQTSTSQTEKSFAIQLKEAIEKIDGLQKEADKAASELAVECPKNFHETMIALERANISLQLMLQVKDKIVSTYETVMRMQV